MNVIKRNLPIFIIGLITLLIFVVIIFAGQNNQNNNSPTLSEVSSDDLIAGHTYTLGPQDAPVTLVEFSDFQCPACKTFHPIVQSIFQKNSSTLRIALRHFPLPQHPYARKAAEAAQIAGEQGKFWEYTTILFENQENLKETDLIKYAQQVGLDVEIFTTALQSGTYATIVNDDLSAAQKLKISQTPTFFLNGKMMDIKNLEDFSAQINSAIEKHKIQNQLLPQTTPADELTAEQNKMILPLDYSEIDSKLGIVEIAYTAEGFVPRNTAAYKGQLVRYTNKTDNPIIYYQPVYRFDEIKQEVEIVAGGTLEFRLNKTKAFAYREKLTDSFGSIFVQELEFASD
ncbi:MAG TPA: thioredoxin domain-containing protein [Patescibacteria group bacterium]|nr:thioredoxin domain-containing protein [Patescibacteria group bacterium]